MTPLDPSSAFLNRHIVKSPNRQILKRSSNAWRAVFGATWVLVWRSTVVRGSNHAHVLRSSLGVMRATSACWLHSHRLPVSKDTQLMQLWTSTPHRPQRSSWVTGTPSLLPHRAHLNTSWEAIRFGVLGP